MSDDINNSSDWIGTVKDISKGSGEGYFSIEAKKLSEKFMK